MGYWYYKPTKPRKVKGGIKARSKRGEIGSKWWSKRWIGLLESFGWYNRLERGRRYARRGQVIDIKISKGLIESRVQGSRKKPYTVTIGMDVFSESEWRAVIESMSKQALFAAKLLAGEIPQDIEKVFEENKLSLLPRSSEEIRSKCSCPDYANPCKHIAAVYYIVAEEFDRDPFLIFKLRGKTKDEFLDDLRNVRGKFESDGNKQEFRQELFEKTHEPLEKYMDNFWNLQKSLDNIKVKVRGPHVSAAIVKRLGEPVFWRVSNDFVRLMEEEYDYISSMAMKIAFGSKENGRK